MFRLIFQYSVVGYSVVALLMMVILGWLERQMQDCACTVDVDRLR